jgi:hypothetical protein
MNTKSLVLLSVLSLAAPACVVHTTAPRDVGSVAADGSVYLGWHLVRSNKKTNANDVETYDVGAHIGNFSAIRIHAEKPTALAEVLVIFANGERWVAQAPAMLNTEEWSAPIALPGAPRAIHSIVVTGQPTGSLLSKIELHGYR